MSNAMQVQAWFKVIFIQAVNCNYLCVVLHVVSHVKVQHGIINIYTALVSGTQAMLNCFHVKRRSVCKHMPLPLLHVCNVAQSFFVTHENKDCPITYTHTSL